MQVISVDPAPVKDAVVFDGSFSRVPALDLPDWCAEAAAWDDVLLCWDAPLTGPSDSRRSSNFSQRTVDRFFGRRSTGFKVPTGISVRPYCGCPHWAITRACVGLPRVGRFDTPWSELPFQLVEDAGRVRERGRWIAETHPAVAIWLWCRGDPSESPTLSGDETAWIYKGRAPSRTVAELWRQLVSIWSRSSVRAVVETTAALEVPENDDELDAVVGWVLGTLLIESEDEVIVLGDRNAGSFLLPNVPGLATRFSEFTTLDA